MRDKIVKRKVKNKAVVDLETSEMTAFSSKVKLHSYTDFFVAALVAWGTFKVSDGGKIKVFIHCIMVSSPSTSESKDGNCFLVGDVYESIKAECEKRGEKPMCENNIRQYISKLAAEDFIQKTGVRGKYRINPWFGIKGAITDAAYARLVVEKTPSKKKVGSKIKPNENFGKGE